MERHDHNECSMLLTKADVCIRLAISARGLETMVHKGHFPPGVRIGKLVYWSDKAVAAWLQRMFGAQEAWLP